MIFYNIAINITWCSSSKYNLFSLLELKLSLNIPMIFVFLFTYSDI